MSHGFCVTYLCLRVSMPERLLCPARAPLGCCHTQEVHFFGSPVCLFPSILRLNAQLWRYLWSFVRSVHAAYLNQSLKTGHWSAPVKFTTKLTSKPKCTFPISESYMELNQCQYRNNNNNNYYLLNQELYMLLSALPTPTLLQLKVWSQDQPKSKAPPEASWIRLKLTKFH